MAKLFKLPFAVVGDSKKGVAALDKMGKSMGKLGRVQTQLNRNMVHSTSIMGNFGAVIGGLSFGFVTKSILEAGFAMDSFNTLLSQSQIEYLRGLTDELGISLQGSARSFSLLNAAAAGTVLEGEGVEEIFEGMAVASRAFNLSAEDMRGLLRAVEQMMNKGTVQAEELRGQLSERLPGAFTLSARAMGVTTQELSKMLEQGQVLAVDLLPKLAQSLKDNYGDKAVEMSKLGAAGLERFKNELFEIKAGISEGGLGTAFSVIIKDMTTGLKLAGENVEALTAAFGGLALVMTGRMANARAIEMAKSAKTASGHFRQALGAKVAARSEAILALQAAKSAKEAQRVAASERWVLAQRVNGAPITGATIKLTDQLTAANGRLTAANKTLAASRVTANTTALAAAKTAGKTRVVMASMLGLIGGWPTLILAAAAGTYYFVKSLDEFSDETKIAIDRVNEFGQAILDGTDTAKAQTALTALKDRYADIEAQIASIEATFGAGGGTSFFRVKEVTTLNKELTAVGNTIGKLDPAFYDLGVAIADFDTEMAAALDALNAANEASRQQKLATEAAIKVVKAEGVSLKQTAEEKWKSATLSKAMKDNTNAVTEEVLAFIDVAWKEKAAIDAGNKAMKAREKNVKSMIKFLDEINTTQDEYTASLQEELKYLTDVATIGKTAADSAKALREVSEKSNATTREFNISLQTEINRLNGVDTANKKTASSTEVLTSAVEKEFEAYEKLQGEILALATEGYDVQILEAQAAGHLDVAAALEVEKEVMIQMEAQKGNMIQLTEEQIRQNIIHKQELRALADAAEESAGRQEEIWSNMVENVQEKWGDLIYGYMDKALMDGEFKFSEFRDSIWKMFVRLLADMAAQWAVTAIFGGGIGAANAGFIGNFSAIAAGAKSAGAALSGAAAGATAWATGATAATAPTAAVATGMGALAPAAEAAEFATLQLGSTSATTATAMSGLSTVLIGGGIIAAGFALNAAAAAARQREMREATDEVNTAMTTSANVVNTAGAAYAELGADRMAVQLGGAAIEAGHLSYALDDVSDSLQRGYEGTLVLEGATSRMADVMESYTTETADALDYLIEKEKQLNPEFRETADIVGTIGDAAKKVRDEWVAGAEAINATSFQPVIDELTRMTGVVSEDFKAIGADGIFTANEIASAFGSSASDIITAMGGATSITLDELLKILSVGESSADAIAAAFEAAGVDMADGMIDGVFNIQQAIDELRGAEVQSTHTITTINRGERAEGGDGFATGTNGYKTVPYNGYQPTLHAGEKFRVVPRGQVNGSTTNIDVNNGDTSKLVELLEINNELLGQQVGYSESTAKSANRSSLRRLSGVYG